MVKKTIYDHHPMQILRGLFLGDNENHATIFVSDPQTVNLVAVTSTDDLLPWRTYNIVTLAAAAGITIPTGAVGALVDVAVNDSGSSAGTHHMKFAEAGALYASKTWYVYPGTVDDSPGSKQIPIFWTEAGDFAYGVDASGANFDYTLKIVGWFMAGNLYTHPVIPSVELACTFRVNQ
jgi:hypothetical protein